MAEDYRLTIRLETTAWPPTCWSSMSDSGSKLAMRVNASHLSSSTFGVVVLYFLRHTYNMAPQTDLWGK